MLLQTNVPPALNFLSGLFIQDARYHNKRFLKAFLFLSALVFLAVSFMPAPAHAAITEDGAAQDAFFESNPTVGGGAILPLVRFRLKQTSGSDTLSKVGITLVASSTLATSSVSRLSLWVESGAKPGFQLDSDTFIAGAASTSVAANLLATLTPTTAVSIGSTASEFYVVASTTDVTGLTNGHGFNTKLEVNYASTTSGGIGAAFLSNKKVSLNQSATLKISEVKAGSTGNTSDEFIELYNSGESDINLVDLPLSVHSFYANGSSTPAVALTYYRKVIPSHGYFLITNPIGYNGTTPADATFSTSTFNIILPDGGLSIATSAPGTMATSSAIDFLGWGAQGTGNCENADTTSAACAAALAETGGSLERLATGYPSATSTAASMAHGGVDASKGNGFDKNDNSADFAAQATSSPQNSFSPIEFPFGGGGSDTSKLQVQGSFPGSGMVNAPIDTTYIGFMFNKPIATTTVISGSATTTVTLKAAGSDTNLCVSVSYNPFPSNFEPQTKCNLSASLSPNTSYTFTVTSSVYDLSGNALDQDAFAAGNQSYAATFTTGGASFTSTNVTPPSVIGTSPFPGSRNVPSNITTVSVEFNQQTMDTSTLTNTNITLSGSLTLSGFSFSTSTGKNVLTANIGGTVAVNTSYTLTVGAGVRTSQGISLGSPYTSTFTTLGSADTSAPTIVGVVPTSNATILANVNDFVFIFDDNIDSTTATSGAVTLGISGGANLPGSVRYDPVSKEGHFTTSNVLPVGQTIVLTLKGGAIKNVSGTALAADITRQWTVEASNSDTSGPAILFVNADEFSVAITFNEAVNRTDATTLLNYTLTVGGTAQTLSALAGHTLTYNESNRTAKLTGLRLTSSAAVVVSATNIKDVSGNLTTTAPMSGSATVSSATGSSSIAGGGGGAGPGSFSGTTFGDHKDFSGAGIGFMPPVNIRPTSTFINASSTYTFELPISKQIDANGTIVITLPSSSDFGLCCVATTSSKNPFLAQENKDINGPSSGVIGVKTIAGNAGAKTVTLTLDTATPASGNDFLRFSIADLKNPSIPKGIDGSGYSLDIKSKSSAGVLLESFTANPIYIGGGSAGGGATTTIRGTVSGNGGNLGGVTIHIMSPQTGPMDATTNASGVYSFSDIPVNSQFLSNNFGGGGEFYLFTDPFISGATDANGATTTAFFGNTMPTPVQATSTSIITRNFSLTPTSSAVNFTVRLTAAADTFTATETVDVFAGGPGQFVVRTVTPGASALTASLLTTIPIPQSNGQWGIGIGPAMPKGTSGGFSGPPPAPNWSMPRPIEVTISGCPSACSSSVSNVGTTSNTFTISTADKTIAGVLKDGSGNAIANAMVFAYSGSNGNGNHAETSTTGAFSIKVVTGSYVVGSFSPGVGKSRELPVVVDSSNNVFVDGSATASTGSSGANPFVLKMTKPSYTITGQVTDGSNAVGNAPVFAYRTDGPGHADAVTDSSTGNYTMYVDNGTWKVNSFIPGFGPMAEQTVTVAGASKSGINFAPSSSQSFSLYSGNIYDDADNNSIFATSSEGLVGAVIRLSGSSGVNEGVSGADGAFSIRVPSGSGYTLTDIFMPGYGRIAPLNNSGNNIGTLNLTASSTNNYIRVPKRNTVTITVKDSDGNALVVPKAFIDLFNTTTRQGSHIEITNASTTSMQVATGTSPTIRAYVQGVPPSNISVASDGAGTTVSSGVVTIDNTTEAVKIVVNTTSANLSAVAGTVYKTAATAGNELSDAWIQFIDETNGVHFGTQATSSGTYNVKAANGTYQVIVSKPGYIGTPLTVTVSGTTTQNFILDSASLGISGTVTAGGVAAANAFVRAEKIGGGQSITQTDTSGAFTLSVTSGNWKVFATADGYKEGAASGNPIAAGTSGVSVALTTTVTLQSKLATSNTFTDTSAGSFSDSTVGVKIDLDSNALGASGNSSYFTAKETSNIPNTASVNIVASKAKDINAFSGGSQVKNLQSGKTATVELSYTKAELASSGIDTVSEVSKLSVVSYSEDKKEWESLSTVPTYKDSSGDTVTSPSSNLSNVSSVSFQAAGTHFSAYALSSPTGSEPPATPGGLTATAGTSAGSAIALAWSAASGAEGYFIYRDTGSSGSFPLLVDVAGGSTVSYSDSTGTSGTTYYYKISAYKSSGSSESAASGAVSAKVTSPSGGGPIGGGGGGGGGGAPAPRAQKIYPDGTKVYLDEVGAQARIAELDKKFAVSASGTVAAAVGSQVQAATPAGPSPAASPVAARAYAFTRALKSGSTGSDVAALQTILEAKGFLKIPAGVAKGYFGAATKKALMDYQTRLGLEAVGTVGPKTRSALNAEGETAASASATPSAPKSAPSSVSAGVSSTGSLSRPLKKGSTGADVKLVQQVLNLDAETRIANSGPGSPGSETTLFGALTVKAIEKFQVKYGIANPGDDGYGNLGPKTRAKMNTLIGAGAKGSMMEEPAAPAATPAASPESAPPSADAKAALRAELEVQVEATIREIERLQAEIKLKSSQ